VGPDQTRACFWPTVKKRLTHFWPGYWGKIEKFVIFRWNFPNLNQRWLTRPDPSNKKLTQTWLKIFDPKPITIVMRFYRMNNFVILVLDFFTFYIIPFFCVCQFLKCWLMFNWPGHESNLWSWMIPHFCSVDLWININISTYILEDVVSASLDRKQCQLWFPLINVNNKFEKDYVNLARSPISAASFLMWYSKWWIYLYIYFFLKVSIIDLFSPLSII